MWEQLLNEAGLTDREVRSIMVLGNNPNMRASELAKELQTTRLDAYNSLSRLQEMGIVTATADRPMLFSSLRVDEALQHIIEMRRRQLDKPSPKRRAKIRSIEGAKSHLQASREDG